MSPRFLSYSAVLRPTWTNSVARAGTRTSLRSNSFARDLSGRLSPLSWLSMHLSESDLSVKSTGTFQTTENHVSSLSWGARVGLAPMQLAATVTRRQVEETWKNMRNDLDAERDYQDRILRLSGQNSKTSLVWERTLHRDRVQGEAYEARTGSATHHLAWGNGSGLNSQFDWDRRLDGVGWRQRTWTESARLQHARTFHSEWRYRQFRSRVNGTTGASDAVGAGIGQAPAEWLRWSLNGNTQRTQASGLESDRWSASPQVALSLPLPHSLKWMADMRVAFEHEDLRTDDARLTPVFGERHTVDATRAFLLDNAGVDSTSVAVRDAAQSLTYVAGIDYLLIQAGTFTQVYISPGSRIQEGDLVVVNYRFRFATRRSEDVVSADGSLHLGFPSGSLRHRQTLRSRAHGENSPLSFTPGFNEAMTEFEVVRPSRVGAVRLEAMRRSRSAESARFSSLSAAASLTPPVCHTMSSAFSVRWTRSRGDGRRFSMLDGSAGLSWMIARSVQTGARLIANRTRWSDGAGEHSLATDLQAGWHYGNLDLQSSYALQWRSAPTTQTLGRWSFRASRRF